MMQHKILLYSANSKGTDVPLMQFSSTVKPVLSGHSKEDLKFVFKIDYRLMQFKNIAECSKRAFCSTFDLHLPTICHEDLCFVYF